MQLATFAHDKIANSIKANRLRILKQGMRTDDVYVTRGGRKLISFSCNDYLGLTNNEKVKEASCNALLKYGAGSGASRMVTGNNLLYEELEAILAHIKGTEAALVIGSGFLANIGIIPALAGKDDLIIADKLVHASIIDGCKLSGAKLMRFTHNDPASCKKLLERYRHNYKNCLVITETIFSMDGDAAPIDELYNISNDFDSWLMTDDAHGLGIISNHFSAKPHIQMGTLSKAVGSYGGYVCADKVVIDYLTNNTRSMVYSTALPPAVLAASIASLKIIMNDKALCKKPVENAELFTSMLGIEKAQSAIVPLILGTEEKSMEAMEILESEDFLVLAIRPPTIPKGTSRLRFAFSALHKTEDIAKLAKVVKDKIL